MQMGNHLLSFQRQELFSAKNRMAKFYVHGLISGIVSCAIIRN